MAIRNVTRFGVLLLWIFFGISLAVAQGQLPNSNESYLPFYVVLKNALITTDSNQNERTSISDIDMRKGGLSSALVVAEGQALAPGSCVTEINSETIQAITDVSQVKDYIDTEGHFRVTPGGKSLVLVHINESGELCGDALDENVQVSVTDQLVTIKAENGLMRYARDKKPL